MIEKPRHRSSTKIVSEIDGYRNRHETNARRQKDKEATQGFGKKTFLHPDKITRFTWWVSIFTGCLFATSLIQAIAFIQSERSSIYLSINRSINNCSFFLTSGVSCDSNVA
jgi:hypothetical protein